MSSATSTDASSLRPWQFFVIAALLAATAGVLLSREASPAGLILLSLAIGSAGLAGLGFYRMLQPFAAPDAGERTEMVGGHTRAALDREKMFVLRAIKELEFDYAMGKLSDGDFHDMSVRLRGRAVGLMKQLDTSGSIYRDLIEEELRRRLKTAGPGAGARRARPAGPAPVPEDVSFAEPPPHEGEPMPAQDDIHEPSDAEQEDRTDVSAARAACAACGTANEVDAKFCKECGSRLEAHG